MDFAVPPFSELPDLDESQCEAVWAQCGNVAGAGVASASDVGAAEPPPFDFDGDAATTFAFFTQVRSAVRAHFLPGGAARLAAVVRLATRGAGSLRSAISRHAVVAAGELAAAREARAPLAALGETDALVHALLLRAVSDQRFVRVEAEAALRSLASIAPSTALLFLAFVRHSHSKSRPLSIASAALGAESLALMDAAQLAALDLAAVAAMMACYVTSKSAEARASAAAISRILSRARGFELWADAVRAACKPAEFRGLMSGCEGLAPQLAPAPVAEATPDAAGPLASPVKAAAAMLHGAPLLVPMSPGNGGAAALRALAGTPPGAKLPSLAAYLRRRRVSGGHAAGAAPAEPSPLAPRSPMAAQSSYSALSPGPAARRQMSDRELRRASKSPVLVLKRAQVEELVGCVAVSSPFASAIFLVTPATIVEGDEENAV